MKALILCAGFGTRLRPLTVNCPKPLLQVQGIPVLEYILDHLRSHGITDFAVNVSYLSEQVVDFVKKYQSKNPVSILVSHETDPMGTAGAVKNLKNWIGNSSDLLVYYGDILTDHNMGEMIEFHNAKQADVTLLVHKKIKSNSYIELNEENKISKFLERNFPEFPASIYWVNSGIQILSRKSLELIINSNLRDLPLEYYSNYYKIYSFYAMPLNGNRIAIDSIEALEKAQKVNFKFDRKKI